jgi:precorrin-2/cobalt-factor-2 C20-methyltransferase
VSGRLLAVGVGPGDPSLLTLKAVRAIEAADVVAFIAAPGRPSRARTTAAAHLRPGRAEIAVTMPMEGAGAAREEAYRELVGAIAGALARDLTVAFLCEGDPMFHGSFLHILARAPADWRIEIVPGISSIMAAAAACAVPLAQGTDILTVVPATAGEAALRAAAERAGAVVVIKVGRQLDAVRRAMAATGRLDAARLVVDLGGAAERILPLADAVEAPYFSLVLAPAPGPGR